MEPLSQYHNTYTTQKHKTNTTTTTSIITDYFDFELGDIELNQYKRELNLSKESCAEIASLMKSFQHYLKTNLSSFTYPYFQTAFIPFYSKLNDPIHRIYLLLLFISKKDEIEKTLSSFFRVLIKANHFGIGKQYNSLFTEKVIHSIEYIRFIDKMAKWHTQSEMIIFYIWVLKEYFNVSLSYSKESYSLEQNFRLTFETFAQKNVLKFSSFICSKLSVPFGFSLIDYKTVFFLIMTSFTCGTYSLFTAKQIQKILSASAVNCVIQKLSELMEYEGQLTDFRKLSDTVEYLNENLSVINSMMSKLIKNYLIINGKKCIDDDDKDRIYLQNEVKDLTYKLELYLSGVNPNSIFTEDTVDVIQEIEMRETDNDWCVIQDNNP